MAKARYATQALGTCAYMMRTYSPWKASGGDAKRLTYAAIPSNSTATAPSPVCAVILRPSRLQQGWAHQETYHNRTKPAPPPQPPRRPPQDCLRGAAPTPHPREAQGAPGEGPPANRAQRR